MKTRDRVMHHYFEPTFLVIRLLCDSEAEVCGTFISEGAAEKQARDLARGECGSQFLVLAKRTTWETVRT